MPLALQKSQILLEVKLCATSVKLGSSFSTKAAPSVLRTVPHVSMNSHAHLVYRAGFLTMESALSVMMAAKPVLKEQFATSVNGAGLSILQTNVRSVVKVSISSKKRALIVVSTAQSALIPILV